MNAFLLNILLALIWAAMNGEFRLMGLAVGFVVGYVILFFAQPVVGRSSYFSKIRQVTTFVGFYLWELVLANLRVAYDVITPRHYMRPAVISVPLDARTDEEITALANLITMTPGTLSLDVADDRSVLYVHAMYVHDVEKLRREIKQGFERRILEMMR